MTNVLFSQLTPFTQVYLQRYFSARTLNYGTGDVHSGNTLIAWYGIALLMEKNGKKDSHSYAVNDAVNQAGLLGWRVSLTTTASYEAC